MTKSMSKTAAPLALATLVVAGAAGQARAAPPPPEPLNLTGIFGADYSRLGSSSGPDADNWGVGLGLRIPLNESFSLQGYGGYHQLSGGGADVDSWDAQATGLYKTGGWKLGVTLGYERNSTGGFHGEVKNWGGVADYNAFPTPGAWGWRVHGQAGGYDTNYSLDGSYVGGGLKLYPCPKFAASADINYTRFSGFGSGHETDYSLSGEYQFGSSPFSLSGGYTRSDFSGGSFHIDTWSLGLQYRFGGPPAASIQERQDTGPLPYNPGVSAIGLKF
jgi:hypothetical protein